MNDPTPREIFIVFAVAVIGLITGLSATGDYRRIAITLGLVVAFLVSFLVIQTLRHRLSYYPWWIAHRVPVLTLGVLLLVSSVSLLSRFIEERPRSVQSDCAKQPCPIVTYYPGDRVISRGADGVALMIGVGIGAYLVLVGIRRIAPLTRQRKVPEDLMKIELAYVGDATNSVVDSKSFGPAPTNNRVFELKFGIARIAGAQELYFIALERINENDRSDGKVWTSTLLRPLQPMGLVRTNPYQPDVPLLNRTHKIEQCYVHGGMTLWLYVDGRHEWFQSGSIFQAVAYLRNGGFVSTRTTLP